MVEQSSKNKSSVYFPEFNSKDSVEECIIPRGYEWIGATAFLHFRNLKRVVIPDSVSEIGSNAFSNCILLESINLPKSVWRIGLSAFSDCSKLESIVLPDGVSEIAEKTFKGCTSLKRIVIPNSVRSIDKSAFRFCRALTDVELPKNLKELGEFAFSDCKEIKQIIVPKKIKHISAYAFNECASLTEIEFPKKLVSIGLDAFNNCEKIKAFNLPQTVKAIEAFAFARCTSLQRFELPKKVTQIRSSTFYDCASLEDVVLHDNVITIESDAFSRCFGLSKISLPENLLLLGNGAFSYCQNLKEISIPKKIRVIDFETFYKCKLLSKVDLANVEYIKNHAFTGCESLQEVVIPSGLKEIGKNVFKDCGFKFVYRLEGQNNLVFSKTNPEQKCDRFIDLTEVEELITGFDVGKLALESNIDKFLPLFEKLSRNKTILPSSYVKKFEEEDKLGELVLNKDFRFFNSELGTVFKNLIFSQRQDETLAIFKFADALGCFSRQKVLDKDGRETETPLAQKASSAFLSILKSGVIDVGEFDSLFGNLPLNLKPDQDFLKFISNRDNKKFQNLELLLEFEDTNPGIFERIVKRFHIVKKYRTSIGEDGKPCTVPWRDAIAKFIRSNNYDNITEENKDIAIVFSEHGLAQDVFEEASELRKTALRKKIKNHILSTHLKEESIVEKIEKIKNGTDELLSDSKKLIDELYEQKFTYEMLDKYDPRNAIIGIYCSCCATITSNFYGRHIVKASMTENDVQNLVVKDAKGEIIAKAAMYVNTVNGYVVLNEFELNEKYKEHERDSGYYGGGVDSPQEKDRELIFSAFKRGIDAFVKAYDKEHPNKPILQVVVGMGYNRLKRQCNRYKDVSQVLEIPVDYDFNDSTWEQKVLYERGVAEKKLLVKSDKDNEK